MKFPWKASYSENLELG